MGAPALQNQWVNGAKQTTPLDVTVAPTAGRSLLVAVSVTGGLATTVALLDSGGAVLVDGGNTSSAYGWITGSAAAGNAVGGGIRFFEDIPAGVVTVRASHSGSAIAVNVSEWSNLRGSYIDVMDVDPVLNSGLGSSSPSVGPTATTIEADDLIFVAVANTGTGTASGLTAGFTALTRAGSSGGGAASNANMIAAYRVPGSTGAFSFGCTMSQSRDFAAAIVAIRSNTDPIQRLYFHDQVVVPSGTWPIASPNRGSIGGGQNLQGSSDLREMTETIGTLEALTVGSPTLTGRIWYRRFISKPLAAQTILAQRIGSEIALLHGTSIFDTPQFLDLYVWRPSTGAVVGNIYQTGGADTADYQFTGRRRFVQHVASTSSRSSALAVQAGDVLIYEVLTVATNTGVRQFAYDGTSRTNASDMASNLILGRSVTFDVGSTVVANLLSNSRTVHSPTVAPGGVSVVSPLLANGRSIFSPSIAQKIIANLIANARSVNNPIVAPGAVIVVAPLIDPAGPIFAPTIAQAGTVVEMQAIDNARSINSLKVTQQVAMALLVDTVNVRTPNVSPGAVVVVVGSLTDVPVISNPTISPGAVAVSMQLIDIAEVAFSPTVSPGGVTIQTPLIADTVSISDPKVLQKIVAQLINNPPSASNPKINQQLTVPLLADTITVHNPTILPGGVQVIAQLITLSNQVYSPTVSISGVTVIAQLISQSASLYDPSVIPGGVTVIAEALANAENIYNPEITAGQFVVAGALADPREVISPSVLAGGVTVVSQLLSNPRSVISPSVVQQVIANFISPQTSVENPSVAQKITAQLIQDSISVNDPKIAQKIVAQLIQNGITLYLPGISTGTVVGVSTLDSGNIEFTPTVSPGGVFVSVEPLDQLIEALDPTISQMQLVDVDSLSQAAGVELPSVLAGALAVQAGSLDNGRAVYGPDIYFDQFVVVGILDNPAALNGPRIFVGVIPTNWGWSTQNAFGVAKQGGFPGAASDFSHSSDVFGTGKKNKRIK